MSDWRDPLDGPMAEVAGAFGPRVARTDVAPVEALLGALELPRPRLTVVVVGSNGKTSTATYLSDLFRAAGCRTGLFTSPHIAYWTERVRVDGLQVDGDRLVDAVSDVNELAQESGERFRFFDVLTVAAAQLFAEAGVDVAVYEAGIGGREDATRALRPDLVVLTGVALEHTALLGANAEDILRHKLDVAPPGAVVVAAELPDGLDAVARRHAASIGAELVRSVNANGTPGGLAWYLARNWDLARSCAGLGLGRLGMELPRAGGPREVYGRCTEIARDGAEYVLDVAHNPQAWDAFLRELRGRVNGQAAVGVVSVTRDRPLDEFAEVVASSGLFAEVYVTAASVRPTHSTSELAARLVAAGQVAESCALPATAFARAAARAGGGKVAIFGSTYVVTDAMAWLGEPPPAG